MVNRAHPLQPGSHSLIQLPGLEIPVQCVATDAKLSGQHRLWLPGLRSLFQVGYLVAAQDLGASSIGPSTFCQSDTLLLALANQCSFKLSKGSRHGEQ